MRKELSEMEKLEFFRELGWGWRIAFTKVARRSFETCKSSQCVDSITRVMTTTFGQSSINH